MFVWCQSTQPLKATDAKSPSAKQLPGSLKVKSVKVAQGSNVCVQKSTQPLKAAEAKPLSAKQLLPEHKT